jgi:hypothetical protein
LLGFIVLCYQWSACNIPDSGANEYSTIDTFNSGIDKYYVAKKKNGIPGSRINK